MTSRFRLHLRCQGRVAIATVPLALGVVAHGAGGSTSDASVGGPLRLDLSAIYLASASVDDTPSAEPMTPAPQTDTADLAKQLANPVASLISVPFQFNLDGGFGPKDAERLTLNSESLYDWQESEWTVPINFVVAQILKFGDLPVQLQLGGRYYAESPAGGPEWGVRFGFTLLFPR